MVRPSSEIRSKTSWRFWNPNRLASGEPDVVGALRNIPHGRLAGPIRAEQVDTAAFIETVSRPRDDLAHIITPLLALTPGTRLGPYEVIAAHRRRRDG